MKFTVNMLLTCILYCAPGPAAITTVCKYSGWILITDVMFCSRTILPGRYHSFTSGELYICLETF